MPVSQVKTNLEISGTAKMFNSVRIRLTLWYTAVMTIVLVALAVVTYFVLAKNATRRTDAAVVEQADSFLKTVNAEVRDESGPGNLREGLEAAIAEHRFRDTLFVVLDETGGIIASSADGVPASYLPRESGETLQEATARIVRNERQFQTVRVGRRGYRSYFRHFTVERKDCTLVVLQSLHPQQEFLETVSGTFALVIPLAVLLASAGGYFLARRSLAPVTAMGTQAGKIGADNLHERLPVQNAKDELGQLAKSFNSLLNRLDQSFEQQRRFVADASHELRTPVAILCGEAEVTLSQPTRTSEEYRESLAILRAEARRLQHIVEDLFTLARADAGQNRLVLSKFYLDELVAECARNMRTLAAAKQITLQCESGKELPIDADEALLRRMFINLLDNAIKYTPNGGCVAMACGDRAGKYFVSVRDTGQGIPDEMREHIFERFFRVDKARSRSVSDGGGAGLGLSISRWIAEAHGGLLGLTHSDGQGTTFTVLLPPIAVSPLIPRLSSNQ
jgi:two-component system OmpR family sensor kinase